MEVVYEEGMAAAKWSVELDELTMGVEVGVAAGESVEGWS
jgi:hypothetical protein